MKERQPLPKSRAELYALLGLVDAHPKDRKCHACDTCRKRETFHKDHFKAANEASEQRAKLYRVERDLDMAAARVRIAKAARPVAERSPVLVWVREAR